MVLGYESHFTLLFYSLSEFILNPGLAPDGFGLPMRVWRMESMEDGEYGGGLRAIILLSSARVTE